MGSGRTVTCLHLAQQNLLQDDVGEQKEAEQRCLLLESFPQHVLLEVLRRLDNDSLCFLAQTCRTFLRLCSTPSLWPGRRLGGPLVRSVRYSLASVLHVPPQVLHVRVEEGRSAKFPLSAPLHNLRFVLGAADVDSLAERASGLLQDLIATAPLAATYFPASASGPASQHNFLAAAAAATTTTAAGGGAARLRPSAALLICRADRGFVRLGLRPGVAVARVLQSVSGFTSLPGRPRPVPTQPSPSVQSLGSSSHTSAPPVGADGAVATVDCSMAAALRNQCAFTCQSGGEAAPAAPAETLDGPWEQAPVAAGAAAEKDEAFGRSGDRADHVQSGREGNEAIATRASERASIPMNAAGRLALGLVDELLALPRACAWPDDSCYCGCQSGFVACGRSGSHGIGSNSNSSYVADGCSAGGGRIPVPSGGSGVSGAAVYLGHAGATSSTAVTAAVPAATAATDPAAVAAAEAAQMQLIELALAEVPYAREAWRAFMAGCHQVASQRLRLTGEAAAAPGGASRRAQTVWPPPQPLLAVEVTDNVYGDGDGGEDEDNEGPADDPWLTGHTGLTSSASAPGPRPRPPAHPHGLLGSHLPSPAPTSDLYHLCMCVRLRLLALMDPGTHHGTGSKGGGGSSRSMTGGASNSISNAPQLHHGLMAGPVAPAAGGEVAARGGGLLAPPSTAAAAAATAGVGRAAAVTAAGPPRLAAPLALEQPQVHTMNSSRTIALVYGKLMASVAAAREGFLREAATTMLSVQAVPEADPSEKHAVEAGSVAGREAGQPTTWPMPVVGAMYAAVQAAIDTVSEATTAEANMCLTTSEALLEVQAELAAAATRTCTVCATGVAAAEAAPPASPVGGCGTERGGGIMQVDGGRSGSAWRDPWGVGGRCDGGGGSGLTGAVVTELIRKLCALLSGCLVPAAARLLQAPTRYSPLGVALSPAADDADGGGDGGLLGPTGGAVRMGACLARAALGAASTNHNGGGGGAATVVPSPVAPCGATERREALRGLLLSYLLREMTWALECLGAL